MTPPFDFTQVLEDLVRQGDRPGDGYLHPSEHLTGALRHTQLSMAGAPKRPKTFANASRLNLGTLAHEQIHDYLRSKGMAVMPEVNLKGWLPEGWNGTADCLAWNPAHGAFALVDYKTLEGKGVYYIDTQGAKSSHIWQVSSYLYAVEAMGLPVLTDFIQILYIPITEDIRSGMGTQGPMMEIVEPIDRETLHKHMLEIKTSTDSYLDSLYPNGLVLPRPDFLTDALATPPEREQKLVWDKDKKLWHVRLTPPWGARYCPYEEPLCTCSGLKTEKIGEYTLDKAYSPREGYEDVSPTVKPSDKDIERRKK